MRWRLPLLIALLLLPSRSGAHPLDVAQLGVVAEGPALVATLDIALPLAASLAHLPEGEFGPESLAARADALAGATFAAMEPERGGAPCRFEPGALAEAQAGRLRIRARATCGGAEGALLWRFPMLEALPGTFRLLVVSQAGGIESEQTLSPGRAVLRLEGPPRAPFIDRVALGIEHIGAAPSAWRDAQGRLQLADGIDHLLFLLGLLLLGGGALTTLKTVTGFTLGHTVTLALAAFGLVSLPARFVESAIALSIAWVAVTPLRRGPPQPGEPVASRWRTAALFGLLHGLGFAGALQELRLSGRALVEALAGFSLGVELGQAGVVLLLTPLLLLLGRWPRVQRPVVRGLGGVVFLAGAVWFVQRALGLGG